MPIPEPGCYVALSVSSDTMHPDEIATHLGLTPSQRVVMGTPTGVPSPPKHPYHIAAFRSLLGPTERMETHIEHMLGILEPLKPKLASMQERCRPVIFCICLVRGEDGWELSPELLARMARLGVAFCFS